jgi:hypothetical protein
MIRLDVKTLFFDSRAVLEKVDAATRRVLSRFGAFVRTTARHSIRKRKGISSPGSPPSSHVGTLKRLIFFGYDLSARSVVIGPAPFRSTVEAPPLLEYGGTASRKDLPAGQADRKGRHVLARYAARPFMKPAFEKEKSKLPAMWANSVR